METSFSLYDNKNQYIDKKLDSIFKKENGFFIELGANDGITQSNTAFFEKYRNWKGILIEPSPIGYEKCKINRPNSLCLNYACVSNEYKEEFIKGDFNGGLMSSIDGKRLGSNELIEVKCTTLEKILDKYTQQQDIDFLSIDAEGYELNILHGLNLSKYKPHYILVEIYNWDFDNIKKYLYENGYSLYCNISNYNKIDNPGWDGTHNDYLFYNFTN